MGLTWMGWESLVLIEHDGGSCVNVPPSIQASCMASRIALLSKGGVSWDNGEHAASLGDTLSGWYPSGMGGVVAYRGTSLGSS